MIKVYLTIITIAACCLLPLPVHAAAETFEGVCNNASGNSAQSSAVCKTDTKNPLVGPDGVITKATQILALVTGIAAVIAIMVAGIRYVLSGGESGAVASAKNSIIYAVVGLVIVMVASLIVTFVVGRL